MKEQVLESPFCKIEFLELVDIVSEEKTTNVSFLITICEQGLVQAYAKDGGTKGFHLVHFFEKKNKYLKSKNNIPMDDIMTIMDNSRVAKNKIF